MTDARTTNPVRRLSMTVQNKQPDVPMRVFLTRASGWIGVGLVREPTAAGQKVTGLARSDATRAYADHRQVAALPAPALIDVIGRVPKPRIPRDLGINWPLEPSEAHTRPRRR